MPSFVFGRHYASVKDALQAHEIVRAPQCVTGNKQAIRLLSIMYISS